MSVELITLDDALTDLDPNRVGWRCPTAGGPEGYTNDPQGFVNGCEIVLRGSLILPADGFPDGPQVIGQIRHDLRPHGRAWTEYTQGDARLRSTVDPHSENITVEVVEGTVAAFDGVVDVFFEARFLLASAVA